jgi:hypothetical protein
LPVAAASAILMLVVPGRLLGATVWVVSFTIDDAFPNAKVGSDLGIAYADYRLPPVAGDYGCIEAEPTSTGHLHAVLNRKIDADGTRCNPDGSDRQYRIRLTAAPVACEKLTSLRLGVVSISAGVSWSDGQSRVRVADLFKRPASTPLAFFADKRTHGLSYEIGPDQRPDVGAPEQHPGYDGQGMLRVRQRQGEFVAEAFDPTSDRVERRGHARAGTFDLLTRVEAAENVRHDAM